MNIIMDSIKPRAARTPWAAVINVARAAVLDKTPGGPDEYDLSAFVIRTTFANECDCRCGRTSDQALAELAESFDAPRHLVSKELQIAAGPNRGKRVFYRFMPDLIDASLKLGNSLGFERYQTALLACRLGITGITGMQFADRVPREEVLAYLHDIRDCSETSLRHLWMDLRNADELTNGDPVSRLNELLLMHGYNASPILSGAHISGLASHLRKAWTEGKPSEGTNGKR